MQSIQEMARGVGRATRNGGSGFVRFAKRDPLPLALVSVGLAWLITDGVRHRTNSNGNPGFRRHKDEHSHHEHGRGGRRSAKLRARAHHAVDTLADAAETATERVSEQASAVGHRLGNSMRERPYVTAAASLAGVAALGAITYAVMPHR